MFATPPPEQINLRRADTNERFVAFAFASADLMVECEPDGTISYATGAFLTKFGRAAEAFIGAPLASLIAPADQEAVALAIALLCKRGRLMPMTLRLADPGRTALALAGIVLPLNKRPVRLCLTFARIPEQTSTLLRPATAQAFARSTEGRMREGSCREIFLLEVAANGETGVVDSAAIGKALEMVAPMSYMSELSPGRYGVLGADSLDGETLTIPAALDGALRLHGCDLAITATRLSLSSASLTPTQAARALRHALNTFAREGTSGLVQAGLGSELAGYLHRAGRKTDILRRVLRDERFSLSFQPIVSLANREPHHYEALIRPKAIPELPLAGPQEFVMLIEALGLADELDLCVARLACDRAAAANLVVGFNISGQSVQDPSFRKRLLETLGDHPACRTGLMIVEITETSEIDDIAEALKTTDALRDIGVFFCLDDFGAGAADMRLLRALTPNIVKLDGSYIPGIVSAGRERAFIAGMVEIARAVGAEIVAERVETEDEARILAALGVQYGQGWLFGRPEALPTFHHTSTRSGEVESWG